MNIFYLSGDAEQAARMMCDKHVVKMIVETAQLLSTAHHVLDGPNAPLGIYKETHKNHPCAVWVRSSPYAYRWAYAHYAYLLKEYTARYGKFHASERLWDVLIQVPNNIPLTEWTDPPQCMPDDCKVPGDTVEAYRNYYRVHKASIARWRNAPVPDWF